MNTLSLLLCALLAYKLQTDMRRLTTELLCEKFVRNYYIIIFFFFLLWFCTPTRVMASSFLRFSRSHTMTHHSRQDSSGRVISSSQRPLTDNTQNSQQANIHALGGLYHNLMGPLSYMRSVVDRNVVMRRIPVHILFGHSLYTRVLIIFR